MPDSLEINFCASAEFTANLLRTQNIGVKKLIKCGDGCKFFIKSADYAKFVKIAENYNKEFTVLKDGTRKSFFKNNIWRFGLYVGFIAVIIAVVFYSRSVTRLEIGGNNRISTEVIYAAVTEITPLPSVRAGVNREEIEKAVIKIDGVSSASAQVKGNTIIVEIYEELDKVDVLDKSDYSDIYSNSDGIVTRVIVYSGTAEVKAGDTVRKGQKLISSDVILDENLTAKEKALGDIYGRVWISKNLTYYPTIIERRRTGRTETKVNAFKKNSEYKGGFSMYEEETQEFYLNSVFPIKMYKTTYYEVEETEAEFDFDANSEGIIKEATHALEETLPEDCIKLRTWYNVKRLDKIVVLDIYYEIETKLT